MTRFLLYGVLVACVLGAAVTAAQQPILRGGGAIVRVFVTVTDRDGRLATTLTQNDFEVRDEGKAQPITLFDNSPQPIRMIVMLDVSGSMMGNMPLLRASSEQLFVRLRQDDLAKVGVFGHQVTISPTFTRNPRELLSALPQGIAEDAPTPLWRGIDEAMKAFGDTTDARKVVVVLSDGRDSGPMFRQPYVSQVEVIERARANDVMVYAIGMRSRMVGGNLSNPLATLQADLPDAGLAKVAEESGGGYLEISPRQDLGAAFAQVADELHSQYLLGFVPPKPDGKVHDLDVRVVSQKGLKPRGRKNYVAPKE
jgi:Ca-activated chloride channel family protein